MNTANRVLWSLIGVVLTAAGVFGVLASTGRIPGLSRDSTVWPEQADSRWRALGNGGWVLALAVALVVAAVGAYLLRAEVRGRRPRAMSNLVSAGSGRGRTRIRTGTLDQALSRDLRSEPTVKRAVAHLTGDVQRPAVAVRLVVRPDADLAMLRGHVDRALRRFGSTAGLEARVREVAVHIAAGDGAAAQPPAARVH